MPASGFLVRLRGLWAARFDPSVKPSYSFVATVQVTAETLTAMRILFVFIEIKESVLPGVAVLLVTPPSRWEPPLAQILWSLHIMNVKNCGMKKIIKKTFVSKYKIPVSMT